MCMSVTFYMRLTSCAECQIAHGCSTLLVCARNICVCKAGGSLCKEPQHDDWEYGGAEHGMARVYCRLQTTSRHSQIEWWAMFHVQANQPSYKHGVVFTSIVVFFWCCYLASTNECHLNL